MERAMLLNWTMSIAAGGIGIVINWVVKSCCQET
jgi:hypothetical protein